VAKTGLTIAVATSCVIVGVWVYLLLAIFNSAIRVEPGWSMAPVNFALATVCAFLLLAAVWGLAAWTWLVGRLWRDLRGPTAEPGGPDRQPQRRA
jgi:hypothetical protein